MTASILHGNEVKAATRNNLEDERARLLEEHAAISTEASGIKVQLSDARRTFASGGPASDRNWLRRAEDALRHKQTQLRRIQARLAEVKSALRALNVAENDESEVARLRVALDEATLRADAAEKIAVELGRENEKLRKESEEARAIAALPTELTRAYALVEQAIAKIEDVVPPLTGVLMTDGFRDALDRLWLGLSDAERAALDARGAAVLRRSP